MPKKIINLNPQMQDALEKYNKGDWQDVLKVGLSLAVGLIAGRVYYGINIKSGEFSKEALKVLAIFSAIVNSTLYTDSTFVTLQDFDITNPFRYFHFSKKERSRLEKAKVIVKKSGKFLLDVNAAFSSASFLFKTTREALDALWAYGALTIETLLIFPAVQKTTSGIFRIATLLKDPRKTPAEYAEELIGKIKVTLESGTEQAKTDLLKTLHFLSKEDTNPNTEEFNQSILNALGYSQENMPTEHGRFIRVCQTLLGTSTPEVISSILAIASTVIYGPSMMEDIHAGNVLFPPGLSEFFFLTSLPTRLSESPYAKIWSSVGMMIILTNLTQQGSFYLWNKTLFPLLETLREIPRTVRDTLRGEHSWPKVAGGIVSVVSGGGVGVSTGILMNFLFGATLLSPISLPCLAVIGALSGAATYKDPKFALLAACALLATFSVVSSIKFATDGAKEDSQDFIGAYVKKVLFLLAPVGFYNGLAFNSTGMAGMIAKLREWLGMTRPEGSYFGYSADEKALVMASKVLDTYSQQMDSASSTTSASGNHVAMQAVTTGTKDSDETERLLPQASLSEKVKAAHCFLKEHFKTTSASASASPSGANP